MNFSNCSRNKFLAKQGLGQPQPMSTGTTICGVIFDGGLVLGADTRATAGEWIFLNVRTLCFIYFYHF
jgi:20S proteasome subunit beta 2